MFATIKGLIETEAGLKISMRDLSPRADLYRLGLTPYTAIRLLLAIEREFDVEFPRRLLTKDNMGSIEKIAACLRLVAGERAAAWAA